MLAESLRTQKQSLPSLDRYSEEGARWMITKLDNYKAALADIERSTGPVAVRRENGSRFALVQSNVDGRDLVGFVEEAEKNELIIESEKGRFTY